MNKKKSTENEVFRWLDSVFASLMKNGGKDLKRHTLKLSIPDVENKKSIRLLKKKDLHEDPDIQRLLQSRKEEYCMFCNKPLHEIRVESENKFDDNGKFVGSETIKIDPNKALNLGEEYGKVRVHGFCYDRFVARKSEMEWRQLQILGKRCPFCGKVLSSPGREDCHIVVLSDGTYAHDCCAEAMNAGYIDLFDGMIIQHQGPRLKKMPKHYKRYGWTMYVRKEPREPTNWFHAECEYPNDYSY